MASEICNTYSAAILRHEVQITLGPVYAVYPSGYDYNIICIADSLLEDKC